jgi:gluconokinase
MIIILMGVSGSGKTTVAKCLAYSTSSEFYDADFFHSSDAKAKMSNGEPLTDEDRDPWLQKIQIEIDQWLNDKKNVVLACSALKAKYRQVLRCDDPRVKLVYLKGSFSLLHERLLNRQDHFMKAELLQSQLDTLEEPSKD